MKHIKVVGGCLVAAFAFATVAASLASAKEAQPPEYGVCVSHVKSIYTNSSCTEIAMKKGKPDKKGDWEWHGADECYPEKHGEYLDEACKTKSAKANKGKYELAPSPTYTSTSGAVTFNTGAPIGGGLSCTGSVDRGAISGPKTDHDAITFEGCTIAKTVVKCMSKGAAAGEIDTRPLDTQLFQQPIGTAFDEIEGSEEEQEGKFIIAEFECETVPVNFYRVSGTTAGAITPPNKMTTTETTEFKAGVKQALMIEYSKTGKPPWEAASPSEEIVTGTQTTSAPIEVRVG